jgi:uncharacterized membrane protein required for colicin V production
VRRRSSIPAVVLAAGLGAVPALALGLGRFGYTLILPAMRSDLHWSYVQASSLTAANSVGYLVGALAAAPVAARWKAAPTALVAAAFIAYLFAGDKHGLELIAPDDVGDGTVALVARFGPLFLAAVVVQQLIERSFASSLTGQDKKLLTAAASVVLGIVAARLMDLYVLHNIGFFASAGGTGGLDAALAHSSGFERGVDVLVTGLVIAAGTTPIHDLATMLKRASG